jgi:uncharacterized protein (TIGR02271 family)
MEDNNPVDIERRAAYWRSEQDWTGYDAGAGPYDADQIGTFREDRETWEADYDGDFDYDYDEDFDEDDDTIEIAEEELRVGKRDVSGDTVRVRSHVVSEPVEEDVSLRREQVNVDRRPADRPAREGDFDEETIEMTETYEEPVVDKSARVIEEVVLRKNTDVVNETVRDTVRHTEVDVEDTGDDTGLLDIDDYDEDFRADYDNRFANSGYTYDQYRPAYRYGYSLANDERYRDDDWNSIEPAVRRRWEETNEGTWNDFGDAVRYGWEYPG